MAGGIGERQERLATFLIYGGLAAIGIGILLTLLLSLGSIVRLASVGGQDRAALFLPVIGPALAALGLLSLVAGFVYGVVMGRKQQAHATGNVIVDPNAHVVAKFGISDEGELLTQEWQFEREDIEITYLVKLQLTGGRIAEFQTSRETWEFCGDGMWGEATMDGLWLGRFVPRRVATLPPDPIP